VTEDYSDMVALKSCFYRSFITSFGVDFYKEEHKASQSAFCSFFFEKKQALFGRFKEKV
jgi:hypothetical protein